MKNVKMSGFIFLVMGALAIFLGVYLFIDSTLQASNRIYTTATIVNIETRDQHGTNAHKPEHLTYVEYEADGETIYARLDYYDITHEIGKEVDIYYLEDNMEFVYAEGTDYFYLITVIFGLIIGTLGFLLVSGKIKA